MTMRLAMLIWGAASPTPCGRRQGALHRVDDVPDFNAMHIAYFFGLVSEALLRPTGQSRRDESS